MNQSKRKRRRKLIKPGLQLRLTGAFGAVAALAMLLQFLLLGSLMMRAASSNQTNRNPVRTRLEECLPDGIQSLRRDDL